jgi:hypothetical protein
MNECTGNHFHISAGGPTTFCQGGSVLLTATCTQRNSLYNGKGTESNIPGATSPTYLVNYKRNIYLCQTTSACDTELSTSAIAVNVKKTHPPVNHRRRRNNILRRWFSHINSKCRWRIKLPMV